MYAKSDPQNISLFLKILIIQGSTLNIYFYINFEMLSF